MIRKTFSFTPIATFLVTTLKNIQRHIKTMISQWFPLRSWGVIFRTLYYFSCVFSRIWVYWTRNKQHAN
jgi:hypothetical protein